MAMVAHRESLYPLYLLQQPSLFGSTPTHKKPSSLRGSLATRSSTRQMSRYLFSWSPKWVSMIVAPQEILFNVIRDFIHNSHEWCITYVFSTFFLPSHLFHSMFRCWGLFVRHCIHVDTAGRRNIPWLPSVRLFRMISIFRQHVNSSRVTSKREESSVK